MKNSERMIIYLIKNHYDLLISIYRLSVSDDKEMLSQIQKELLFNSYVFGEDDE